MNYFYFIFLKAICIAGELSVNIKDSTSYSRVIKELYDDEKYRFVVGVIVFAQEDSVRYYRNKQLNSVLNQLLFC